MTSPVTSAPDRTRSLTGPINIVAVTDGTSKKNRWTSRTPTCRPWEDRFFGDFGSQFWRSARRPQPMRGSFADQSAVPVRRCAGPRFCGSTRSDRRHAGADRRGERRTAQTVPVRHTGDGEQRWWNLSGVGSAGSREAGFQLQYAARQGQDVQTIATLPTLIDTGTSSTAVRTQSGTGPFDNGKGQLELGTTFIADQQLTGGHPLQWTFRRRRQHRGERGQVPGRSDVR